MVLFNRHVSSDEKFDEHNMTLHWNMIGLPEDLEVGHAVNLLGHCVALSSKSECLKHALTGYLPTILCTDRSVGDMALWKQS